jgi:hypothetical protein
VFLWLPSLPRLPALLWLLWLLECAKSILLCRCFLACCYSEDSDMSENCCEVRLCCYIVVISVKQLLVIVALWFS